MLARVLSHMKAVVAPGFMVHIAHLADAGSLDALQVGLSVGVGKVQGRGGGLGACSAGWG